MMEGRKALSAKSMATVNQNSWDPLSYVEFVSAVVAKVKSSDLVVSLNELESVLGLFLLLKLLLGCLSSLFESINRTFGMRWSLCEPVWPGCRTTSIRLVDLLNVRYRLH
jgi:hypothetical protein